MKSKVIQYAIAEPCHESWEAMTPTQQGRFCQSCAKPVIDFTAMTDAQVLQYMSNTTGSVCGRMTSFQLYRDFTQYEMSSARAFNLRALVLGTALSAFCALNAQAQGEVRTVRGDVSVEQVQLGQMEVDTVFIRDTLFSGRVVDYLAKGFVPLTVVTIYDAAGNELSTTLTNENGDFQLPLVAGQQPYSASFRKEEYEETVYLFADLTSTRGLTVELQRELHIIMGKMIYVEPEEKQKNKE
jgi:hypothetical protein